MIRPKSRRRDSGASLIEFVIVVPVLGMLVFGLFETALMYRTRATLSAATFEAAQQGSLNNAQIGYMRDGLAQGMMPLYVKARSVTGITRAYVETRAKITAGIYGDVDIVAPTKAVFQRFKLRQPVTISGDDRERMREVIPNDNLMWRDATDRTVRIGNQNVPLNVQDANILKVKTFWCHRLLTPVLDAVIYKALTGTTAFQRAQYRQKVPEQLKCDAIPGRGQAGPAYYIAMTNTAVTRMQSAVVDSRDLPN